MSYQNAAPELARVHMPTAPAVAAGAPLDDEVDISRALNDELNRNDVHRSNPVAVTEQDVARAAVRKAANLLTPQWAVDLSQQVEQFQQDMQNQLRGMRQDVQDQLQGLRQDVEDQLQDVGQDVEDVQDQHDQLQFVRQDIQQIAAEHRIPTCYFPESPSSLRDWSHQQIHTLSILLNNDFGIVRADDLSERRHKLQQYLITG